VTDRLERKLTAILAADIAGYSRLVGQDEEGTVAALKVRMGKALPLIQEHGGRVIDTAGDGILAEFPSAVRAIEAATALQQQMVELDGAPSSLPTWRTSPSLSLNAKDEVRETTATSAKRDKMAMISFARACEGGKSASGERLTAKRGSGRRKAINTFPTRMVSSSQILLETRRP
jgi:hypothetical protein